MCGSTIFTSVVSPPGRDSARCSASFGRDRCVLPVDHVPLAADLDDDRRPEATPIPLLDQPLDQRRRTIGEIALIGFVDDEFARRNFRKPRPKPIVYGGRRDVAGEGKGLNSA